MFELQDFCLFPGSKRKFFFKMKIKVTLTFLISHNQLLGGVILNIYLDIGLITGIQKKKNEQKKKLPAQALFRNDHPQIDFPFSKTHPIVPKSLA